MTFEQYYLKHFDEWVNYLTRLTGDREEAEDKIQDIFMYLLTRKKFCEELIGRDEFGKYVHGAIIIKTAQICRERKRRIPTINLEDVNALAWLAEDQSSDKVTVQPELDDFYAEATKQLADDRKLPMGGFDTAGELRQYILVQYARNNRTFEEIGELVGQSLQNISAHYMKIKEILGPLIENFIGKKLDNPEK